tara:strand:+ start:344 stop:529 length:186 start_codon:yes stop_codon:yes gene_type:complete
MKTITKQEVLDLMSKGVKTYKGIKLPSPQGAGTDTQKSSYNSMKAQQFINNYKPLKLNRSL